MLEVLPTDAGGMLSARSLAAYGGPYSLYIRLWRGGMGSPRMIYRSGIPAFDRAQRGIAGEVAFLTLEELTGGLVFRLNINQRIHCVGIHKRDIDLVQLLAQRVRVRVKYRTHIVHRGELSLHLRDGSTVTLQIIVREFKSINRYLAKSGLQDRLTVKVSEAVEEDGGGILPDVLDWFR